MEYQSGIGAGIVFKSEELDNHLKTSNTIKTESVVFAEWNLNDAQNVEKLGNYRNRPGNIDDKFAVIPRTYDPSDEGGYYTGATDADIVVEAGFGDQDQPNYTITKDEKMNLLYSLEDCIKPHRPRSGINKLLYLGGTANQYLDMGGQDDSIQEVLDIARRPRYYMSSRKDDFKYWTSYRTGAEDKIQNNQNIQQQEEYGVSITPNFGSTYYIYDSAPFVVYKEQVPTNKIVIKMQTNVGDVDLGPFRYNNQEISDPLFGYQNQTTPLRWRIEVLKGDIWTEIISFNENSTDRNGDSVIKSDGYVEVSYGLNLPFRYRDSYVYAGELSDESLLPEQAIDGDTFLIKSNEKDRGILKIYDAGEWRTITPEYGWELSSQTIDIRSNVVKDLTDPDYFINEDGNDQFREFEFIRGIRVVVDTMLNPECTFDLIEFSPRLFVDVSDKVSNISITKAMSDLGNGSIPVGNIVASIGTLDLFDDDFSFNRNNFFDTESNTGSIAAKYVDKRVKFNFYQVVKEVDSFDYFIPIKAMYTDEIPSVSQSTSLVNITLRDFFFHLESSKAPEILITNASISYAVTLLLDYMGFSNYVFKRVENTPEIIIPYFFVAPDQNVAEVLQQLAVASQTAMFFDEYNNLIVMSKEYLLPENGQRQTDSYLYGQQEDSNLPNIINLSSEEKRVYNDGRINYTTRYIQRAISEYSQAPYTDKYKTYGYKPSLLWEVSGKENLRTKNELAGQSQGYTLSAAPLNSDLSDDVPVVENNEVVNNIIDLGENIDAGLGGLSAYEGYLYSNGEIIRYDAIEYSISGNLNDGQLGNLRWISSNQEYQRYFSKLPFNGKIYPTGNVRIYAEPEYETVNGITQMKNGAVKKHGRGQFGTQIAYHSAGLNQYWSNNDNVFGCIQRSKEYLFNTDQYIDYPELLTDIKAGKINEDNRFFDADKRAKNSSRNGIIKNFRANKYYTEREVNYFSTARVGTVQSSALVFQGPELPDDIRPSDFISYVHKDLSYGTANPSNIKRSFIVKYKDGYSPYPLISGRYPQGTQAAQDNIELVIKSQLGDVDSNTYVIESDQQRDIFYSDSFVDNIISQIRQSEEIESIEWNSLITIGGSPQYRHFGTRMRIVGKIESTNQKSSTPFGAFPIYDAQDLDIDDPEKNIQILGGAGGIGVGVNKERNTGYFFEIVSLTQDNINQYTNTDREQFVSYNILSNPAPSCVNNVVTVRSETNIDFVVGQRIIVTGLVDSLDPTDTRTPLNGEYEVTAINDDGKTFQYTIPGDSIANRTSTTGGTAFVSTNAPNNIANIYFYKNVADKDGNAIPYRLWSGTGNIIPDDGRFVGQYRFTGEENPTVYDLSVEFVNIGTAKRFYLYINGVQVATVDDEDPLPFNNSVSLFVRGSSRCMFENVYAVATKPQNILSTTNEPISKIPKNDNEVELSESIRRYVINGAIQKTYLSNVNAEGSPNFNLYIDEFGTIMREAAYLNIKYDRAYPALYARIMKTFNRLQAYAVSGFYAGSYGAEFLLFNCTDTNINLDDTTGNFLRIQGITFTQSTSRTLTVDDYYQKISSLSDPIYRDDNTLYNPFIAREEYNRIVNSRSRHGINEFTLESDYIQTDEAAEDVFGWVIGKISQPKILVGLNTFATFNLQLGDIIEINYKNNDGLDIISDPSKRFVVYNMEYNKSFGDENMTMYLAEV